MEDEDNIPPFWQPPAAVTLARRRHRRQPLSPLLNSSLLIILLPSFTLLFIVFIFIPWISKHITYYNKPPPIPINTTPQIHKSISIRKSWDSLNIVLVIFAILCGIFAKRKDDVSSATETDEVLNNTSPNNLNNNHQHRQHLRNELPDSNTTSIDDNPSVLLHRSKSSVPHWFHYTQSQGTISPMNNSPGTASTGISRLRRTVSSDPYMRYHNTGTHQFRFFDDLDISKFYPKEEDEQEQAQQFADMAQAVKEIPVDTFVLETQDELPSPTFSPPKTPPRDPPAPPQTPPPPPPPPPPPAKQRRTFQTIPHIEESPSSPPSSPPPPAVEKKRGSRRRMKGTKEIATAIVSLYSNRKRKRRAKSRKNCDETSENQSDFIPPPSPPPPPPPPPPPTVLNSWFKKSSKSKKIHSLSSIPTPPTGKPPLPRRRDVISGNESPINIIPPAPPPPPFKVTGMKFPVVGGGYMRVEGRKSWRCEMEGEDDGTSTTSNGREEGVTCQSPDVNRKADTFIARQQDGWRLEKLNSWREKQKNKTGNGW